MIEIHLILLFMIAAAVIAIEAKDNVSSVVAVGGVGIGLCMAFLALKAPDLAITQLVVEILSLIILVRATIRRDLPFSTSGRWYFNTASTAVFVVAMLGAAYFALRDIAVFGQPLARASKSYLDEAVSRAGSENVVEAIALNFRSIDTLGEVAAVFAAIVGVLAIARRSAREGKTS